MTASTKKFLAIALMTAAAMSCGFAGPERFPDQSKEGKEVQMTQQPPVCDPRWYLSIGGGIDVDVSNSDLNQSLRPHYFNNTLTTAYIKSHDWNDVYDNAWRIQGELGYVLTEHLELFGLFKYAHADASDRTRGSRAIFDLLFVPPVVYPISTKFDDFDSWGGELGFRFFFLSKSARLRPYLALSAGASHVDNIDIATFVDFSGSGGPPDERVFSGGFFDDSWVATGSARLGLELAVNCHWSLGVEGGVRYQSRLSEKDSDFTPNSLHFFNTTFDGRFLRPTNNDAGDRWTVPVNGYVKFRF